MRPSAEIVHVEGTKCRRECDLSGVRATLCGDRAGRAREMQCVSSARKKQARVRFVRCARKALRRSCVPCARNPLRRSCGSSARNAGESAICLVCAQPSAEIVRVECAKCRRECDLSHTCTTLCGDRAGPVREKQARGRLVPRARVSGELEDENWGLGSATLVGGVVEYLGSWKMRTGDLVVQL